MTCQEATVRSKVPKEEAAVEAVRALKERYSVIERRKRNQDDGVSRKKLGASRRGVTPRVITAPHEGRGRTETTGKKPDQGQCGKRNVKRTDVREETTDAPAWQQWNKRRDLKEQLRLRKERTSGRMAWRS